MGQRDVCGKCGTTQEKHLRRWQEVLKAPLPPNVEIVGSERDAFMYCNHCQSGICGDCIVDLGVTGGCPICKAELVYMDGGKQ